MRCGLLSKFFDHLLLLGWIARIASDAGYCYRWSNVICLLVCRMCLLARWWAMQKRLNRSRCRLGGRAGPIRTIY